MLDELKAFVATVDHNSLTKAADVLALTQSAVSRRIQQLETSLGAELLDRSTKPPVATPLGRRIYERAISVLREVDRLRALPREDAEPSGTFRLGFTQVVADAALFETVMRMKREFPALGLQCSADWSTDLEHRIKAGDLDAATLMLPRGSSLPGLLHGLPVATLDVQVVQSKRFPLVDGEVQMYELASKEWILNPQGCGYREALSRVMHSAGRQLRMGVDTHGTDMQLRLIAAGLGLGLVPRSLLWRSELRPQLETVSVPGFSLYLDIWLVYPREIGNLKRAVDVLADVLRQTFALYEEDASRS